MSGEEVDPALLKCVGSDEILHRRVLQGASQYVQEEGRWRLKALAFAERSGRPSLDRRVLRPDPRVTQAGDRNAVVQLAAAAIRAIDHVVQLDAKGAIVGDPYAIDVHPDPVVPDNMSHSEVRPSPEFKVARLKEKLEKALQRLVNESPHAWVIPVWESRHETMAAAVKTS